MDKDRMEGTKKGILMTPLCNVLFPDFELCNNAPVPLDVVFVEVVK